MKIIDRYVLRQFLQTFAICFLSLTGLYIVFDAFTNLEEFLRCSDQAGGLLPLMGSFYGYQSILFLDRTSGLLALVAAMFTVSWLQRHHEATALLSAGISRTRIVKPIVIAAVVISLLSAASRELVIPRLREQLSRRPQDLIGDVGQPLDFLRDYRTDIFIRGDRTFADCKRIEKPDFLLPVGLRDYGRRLLAENAFYHPPAQGRPGGYLLDGVRQPENLAQHPSLCIDGQPVIITPHDAPEWLKPRQCFVVSEVTFEQLTGGRAFREFSSTAQLIAGLHNPSLDFGGDVRVAIHSRLVKPFLDVTLLMLGLPLIASRQSRNVFLAIGTCVGVVAVFLLVVIGFRQLGALCLLDPDLAAWAPLILFVPPAVGLAESMRR